MRTAHASRPTWLLHVGALAALAFPGCSATADSSLGEPGAQIPNVTTAPWRPELHEHGAVQANKRICEPAPGKPTCDIRALTDESGIILHFPAPKGFGATDLESAYNVPTSIQSQTTIAIVDWDDDPTAESDLAVYRAMYGLPPCTTANGCFKKQMIGSMPTATVSQQVEIALDIQMASAGCPSCKILLVEDDDEYGGINAAVAAGATVVSLSWGAGEGDAQYYYEQTYLDHPGVAIFAATGDGGYTPVWFPAASQYVTGVGGTSLYQLPAQQFGGARPSRFWTETAWAGAGSGCSGYEPKPWWQTDTGCSKRTVADVSAVADPGTGVAVYSTSAGGWVVTGGTSASSPLVAGIYAQTRLGNASQQFLYENASSWFYDVTSGSTGSCGSYLCNAGPGYDGPTGLGSPNGARMASSPEITAISPNAAWDTVSPTVTITGSAFSTLAGWTQVTFNGVPARSVTCSSSSSCTATLGAPGTPETGDIVVSVGGHKSPVGPQDQFTFEQPIVFHP